MAGAAAGHRCPRAAQARPDTFRPDAARGTADGGSARAPDHGTRGGAHRPGEPAVGAGRLLDRDAPPRGPGVENPGPVSLGISRYSSVPSGAVTSGSVPVEP